VFPAATHSEERHGRSCRSREEVLVRGTRGGSRRLGSGVQSTAARPRLTPKKRTLNWRDASSSYGRSIALPHPERRSLRESDAPSCSLYAFGTRGRSPRVSHRVLTRERRRSSQPRKDWLGHRHKRVVLATKLQRTDYTGLVEQSQRAGAHVTTRESRRHQPGSVVAGVLWTFTRPR
jgi:hypothetical protein